MTDYWPTVRSREMIGIEESRRGEWSDLPRSFSFHSGEARLCARPMHMHGLCVCAHAKLPATMDNISCWPVSRKPTADTSFRKCGPDQRKFDAVLRSSKRRHSREGPVPFCMTIRSKSTLPRSSNSGHPQSPCQSACLHDGRKSCVDAGGCSTT